MKPRAAPAAGAAAKAAPFSSPWLALQLRQLIGPLSGQRFCLAYSGGADSTALLAAMAALRGRRRFELRALHVNHQLQPAAGTLARAARASARRLGVPCQVLLAPVTLQRGASPEAAARAVRYAALQAELRKGDWLVLAQHQEDQAETVFLQLLRGAGLAGLAAMPARAGVLLRPLLDVPREQLLAYLRRRGIGWTDDPSNAEERYDRNYLRLRVLPLLRARWPSLGLTFGRSAALAAEAQGLLAEAADVQLAPAWDGPALRVSVLRRLGAPQRRNALRRWLDLQGIGMPDQRRLQEIAGPLLRARHDAQPRVRWSGGEVRRHGDRLHAEAEPDRPSAAEAGRADRGAPQVWMWRRKRRLLLPGGAWLEMSADQHGSLLERALPDQLRVAFRSPDGRVGGRPGGQRLKRLLQSLGLPPWGRGEVPLIYAQRRLIAVGDRWQAPEVCATAGARAGGRNQRRLRLRWRAAGR